MLKKKIPRGCVQRKYNKDVRYFCTVVKSLTRDIGRDESIMDKFSQLSPSPFV